MIDFKVGDSVLFSGPSGKGFSDSVCGNLYIVMEVHPRDEFLRVRDPDTKNTYGCFAYRFKKAPKFTDPLASLIIEVDALREQGYTVDVTVTLPFVKPDVITL